MVNFFSFLLFFFSFVVYSNDSVQVRPGGNQNQEEEKADEQNTQSENAEGNVETKKEDEPKQQGDPSYYESLDKKYYDYYFETLPNKKQIQDERLSQVLYKSYRDEIYRVRKSLPPGFVEKVTPDSIKYEKVDENHIWWRGIKNQLRHILQTDHMYIVTYGQYYCLFTFVTDPSQYIQSPVQAQLLLKNS